MHPRAPFTLAVMLSRRIGVRRAAIYEIDFDLLF